MKFRKDIIAMFLISIIWQAVLATAVQAEDTLSRNHAVSDRHNLALQMAALKSFNDLQVYERLTDPTLNPLNVMTPVNKKYFTDHLTFNEKGISGFSYAPLTGLSTTEAYRVLSLFGVQDDIRLIRDLQIRTEQDRIIMQLSPDLSPIDHPDYWCSGRATGAQGMATICTSNC